MIAFKDDVVKKMTGGVGFLFNKNKIDHLVGRGASSRRTPSKSPAAGGGQPTKPSAFSSPPAARRSSCPASNSTANSFSLPPKPSRCRKSPSASSSSAAVTSASNSAASGAAWAEVLVLEFLDGILPPPIAKWPTRCSACWKNRASSSASRPRLNPRRLTGDKVRLTCKTGDQTTVEEADRVLVCVGRKPVTDGLGLAESACKWTSAALSLVDEHFATNVPGIWAIGDAIGGIMLAHKAEEEGIAAVELMAGKSGHVNYAACPAVVYTHPELPRSDSPRNRPPKNRPDQDRQIPLHRQRPRPRHGRSRRLRQSHRRRRHRPPAGRPHSGRPRQRRDRRSRDGHGIRRQRRRRRRAFHAHPTLPEALKEAAPGGGETGDS
jgi:dihydrolipoamide dehydrogenase